jgi:hypothetical protein
MELVESGLLDGILKMIALGNTLNRSAGYCGFWPPD